MLSSPDEAEIVDLLCRVLDPVGNYRREHIKPSTGKSSRKRKRKRRVAKSTQDAAPATDAEPAPPAPEVSSHITLGFNTTIRRLELLSAVSRPQSLGGEISAKSEDETGKSIRLLPSLSAVFICRTGLPPILTSSLPLLAATASSAFPKEPPIRLVPLSKAAEDKLAIALHQPKVGFVGLQADAPAAEILTTLVRDRIPPVDVPWLREASSSTYLPVKVRRTEVNVRPRKKKVEQ